MVVWYFLGSQFCDTLYQMILKTINRFNNQAIELSKVKHHKPSITFSYGSSITVSHVLPVNINTNKGYFQPRQNFAKTSAVTHFSQKQRPGTFDPSYQDKEHHRRRKIFDISLNSIQVDRQRKEHSVIHPLKSRNRVKSAIHYKELKKTKKRNNIFQDYHHQTLIAAPIQSKISTHLFPLKRQPTHPRNLVEYVDLGVVRKNSKKDLRFVKKETYVDDLIKEKESNVKQSGFRVFDQSRENSPKKNNNFQTVDLEPLNRSLQLQAHTQVLNQQHQNQQLLESIPRFFDKGGKQQIPPIHSKDSFVDINILKSTGHNQWRAFTQSGQKQLRNRTYFFQKLTKMLETAIGHQNMLPIALVSLGFLLMLIQLIR